MMHGCNTLYEFWKKVKFENKAKQKNGKVKAYHVNCGIVVSAAKGWEAQQAGDQKGVWQEIKPTKRSPVMGQKDHLKHGTYKSYEFLQSYI